MLRFLEKYCKLLGIVPPHWLRIELLTEIENAVMSRNISVAAYTAWIGAATADSAPITINLNKYISDSDNN